MSETYTVLWNSDRVQLAKQHQLAGSSLRYLFGGPHTSQPSFSRAGVGPQDTVCPVYVRSGVLHLLTMLTVDRIVSIDQFVAEHPDLFPAQRKGRFTAETLDHFVQDHPEMKALLWTCTDEVLLACAATPLRFDLTVPPDVLSRLTYRSSKADRPLKGIVEGRLTSIVSLQGVYRLAPSSARDFAVLVQ